jgi:MFS transporter, DHA2 family, multidrug resistance protein
MLSNEPPAQSSHDHGLDHAGHDHADAGQHYRERGAAAHARDAATAAAFDLHTPSGAAFLDGAVTQQAAMIAYIDDFWLMLILTVAVMPLLLLIKPPARAAIPDEATAVMD